MSANVDHLISGDAVRAVAHKLADLYGPSHDDFTDDARCILAAGLPFLGDVRTEYSVQIERANGDTYILADEENVNVETVRSDAERTAEILRNGWTSVSVVDRTVINGNWK